MAFLLEDSRPKASSGKETVAVILAGLSCFIYCLNGQLLDALQSEVSAFVNLTLCHVGGLLFVPYLVYTRNAYPIGVKSCTLAWTSLFFSALLMGYNYVWLKSALIVPVGLTNAVFQTSVAMVFIASIQVFGETLTEQGCLGVMLAVSGFVVATLPDFIDASTDIAKLVAGICLATAAAVGVTFYQVLFRLWFGRLKSDLRFLMMFGAYVGAWHLLLMPVVIVLADWSDFERCQFPPAGLALLGTAASGVMAFIVNAMTLCIILWGFPMLFPCSSALTVPLMVVLDFMVHGLTPNRIVVFGYSLVFLSVLMIAKDSTDRAPKLDDSDRYSPMSCTGLITRFPSNF